MILGFGSTVQKTYPGTTFELLSSTLDKALEMAHLDRGKIDGLIATFLPGTFDGNLALHFYTGQLAQYLGIRPRFLDYVDFGEPQPSPCSIGQRRRSRLVTPITLS